MGHQTRVEEDLPGGVANLISHAHYGSTTSREDFRGRGSLEDARSVY